MSIVDLKRFGLNLAGRPLGIKTFPIIQKEYSAPYELDFEGVFSIGSSFADEVVAKLASLNQGVIKIHNSNSVIDKCLTDVSREQGFEIILIKEK